MRLRLALGELGSPGTVAGVIVSDCTDCPLLASSGENFLTVDTSASTGPTELAIRATSSAWAPWFVARSDDKKRARLNVITHLLGRVPYEPVDRKKVVLPNRTIRDVPPDSETALPFIPEPF